ncbi:MAG TPA: YjbQ family protein [Pelolinea sp.]|nr:YjbQ family protein [Pelolinea sp.]
MEWIKDMLELRTHGKGMIKINAHLDALIQKLKVNEGICFLFLQHVSASLSISEGFDPPARADVEEFYERRCLSGRSGMSIPSKEMMIPRRTFVPRSLSPASPSRLTMAVSTWASGRASIFLSTAHIPSCAGLWYAV